jgi:hypothetical protein
MFIFPIGAHPQSRHQQTNARIKMPMLTQSNSKSIQRHTQAQFSLHEQEQKKFILHQNQSRLPFENRVQQRIIIPTNNIIDLHNNINSNVNCNKTIVHVIDISTKCGFGDFLRGSILLAQYAKYYNINFKLDVSRHAISKYLNTKTDLSQITKNHLIVCH